MNKSQTQKLKGVPGLWYDQPPGEMAVARRWEAQQRADSAAQYKVALANLVGDGAGTFYKERESLNASILATERLQLTLLDMADAFDRIAARGGRSGDIDSELAAMSAEGIARRHPHDVKVEKELAEYYATSGDSPN
jgi:hypothetical protein